MGGGWTQLHTNKSSLTLALRVTADDNVKSSCSNSASSRYWTKLTGVGTGAFPF